MSGRQLTFDLPHRPALGRTDFLVAPCNAEAVAWIDRWPAWSDGRLVLYGTEGAGKSHLAEVWRQASGAEALRPEQLGPRSLEALATGGSVLLDDVERELGGAREVALLHLVNAVREGGGSLLLCARTPPARWPLGLADLASRLCAAPAVGIGPPDDELLAAVLAKFFRERQIRVAGEVINYLLSRIERSFAAAQRAAQALDAAALAGKQPITVPLARRILEVGRSGPAVATLSREE
jgi:chromosomal replication initiation ATPase DnaA